MGTRIRAAYVGIYLEKELEVAGFFFLLGNKGYAIPIGEM